MYVVVEISGSDSIAQLNAIVQDPGKPLEAVIKLRNYCDAILAGCKPVTVKIVTKDAATTIATSGSGSQSETYDLS